MVDKRSELHTKSEIIGVGEVMWEQIQSDEVQDAPWKTALLQGYAENQSHQKLRLLRSEYHHDIGAEVKT